MSRYVKIYYGPCEEFHTVSHKPQKLYGLRDKLLKLGYRVVLVPVEYRNYCVIELNETEVFRCNIRNLGFNVPYELDPVCHRALYAVQTASSKLSRADTYLWLEYLLLDQMFKRTQYGPQDHWPFELHLGSIKRCRGCSLCCNKFYPTPD